ncbi:Fanconi anemia group F protein [Alligator mississippiensis]|uniref:Fanconi anemia group F protein n=1 Tax=Alligator mississippiensis TaxID=8496 RepID=UPI0028777F1D|nr:Fanconi anemia group F protein [Alligator mississippiensis]
MEVLLGQAEQLPSLLGAARSALAARWDAAALQRALRWARYFQQLHDRFRARPRVRAALAQRLARARPPLAFAHLGRCPRLLALALLENRAAPPSAAPALLAALLPAPALLARRKAAARAAGPDLRARTEAQLLLARLREDAGRPRRAAALLEMLPAARVAAAALLLPPDAPGDALLAWLPGRLAALPAPLAAQVAARHPALGRRYVALLEGRAGRLRYDPLRGCWDGPWEELRGRWRGLWRAGEPLRAAARACLLRRRAEDGGFRVCGLSVWTDLLLDLEADEDQEQGTVSSPSTGLSFLHA